MEVFDIWVEGNSVNGELSTAQKVNAEPVIAESFNEAVTTFIQELPEQEARKWWRQDEDDGWLMWGCRAFPDEASARETFG